MTLLLFLIPISASSLPLTETLYIIPDEEINVQLQQHFYHNNSSINRMDTFVLGFGLFSDLSLWISFDVIHGGPWFHDNDRVGDTSFYIKWAIGDFFKDTLHIGYFLKFKIPTGSNQYTIADWRNMSAGINQITTGVLVKYDLRHFFFHFNLFYVFQEEAGKNFYNGFHFNPLDQNFYTNIIGFNLFSENAFLYYENLKNDYVEISLAINTDYLYPFIPFVELKWSVRLYRGLVDATGIAVKGGDADPLELSFGANFFILPELRLGAYGVFTLIPVDGYTDIKWGFDVSLQF